MTRARQKKLKKLTRERLEATALRYVGRYAATRAMLARVLDRHIQKSAQHDTDFSVREAQQWKNDILARAVQKNWVDDAGLAQRFVENGKVAGLSRNRMQQKLIQKGVSRELVRESLDTAAQASGPDGMDLESAQIFARKKGLGPYRRGKDGDAQKELAKMCRAGYSLDTARKALKLPAGDED